MAKSASREGTGQAREAARRREDPGAEQSRLPRVGGGGQDQRPSRAKGSAPQGGDEGLNHVTLH